MTKKEAVRQIEESLGREVKVIDWGRHSRGVLIVVHEDFAHHEITGKMYDYTTTRVTTFAGDQWVSQGIVGTKRKEPR